MVNRTKHRTKSDRSPIGSIFFSLLFVAVMVYNYVSVDMAVENVTASTIRASTESAHGDMVLLASQALRSEIVALIAEYEAIAENIDWATFSRSPLFVDFDTKVRDLVAGTNVVKLKIYADDSITVYSSDPSQVGEEKSEIEQVTHALRGRSSSQVTVRETFNSFNGELLNVDIVSSYHPLFDASGETIGVVEIYSDRTIDFVHIRDYGQTQVGQFLIALALALSVWLAHLIFGSLRERRED